MARLACALVAVLSLQAAVKVIEWESITEQQFKSLPASQPVRVAGQQTTLGDLRSRVSARAKQGVPSARPTAAVVRGGTPLAIDVMRRDQQAREAALRRDINAAVTRLRAEKPTVPYTHTGLPSITAVIGIMQPGGAVVILGKNFGFTKGRVQLLAEDRTWSLDLEDLEWYPGGIAGTLPNAPKVTSFGARFIVHLRSGAVGTPFPVQWIADVKPLERKDVGATCGTDSNNDSCNGQGDGSDFCSGFVKLPSIGEFFSNFKTEVLVLAIEATHENCWGAFSTDKGTDVYQINLKNGWTLQDFEHRRAVKTGASVTDPAGFVKGATSWTFSIDWFAHPDSAIHYGTIINIRGPKGIPHK